jgi:galactokinase
MDFLEPAPSVQDLAARAAAAFQQRLGGRPTHAAFAPGRVNLIGEHTDYNQGFVLPIAIDRFCVAVGSAPAGAAVSRLVAADLDSTVELDLREPVAPGRDFVDTAGRPATWARYVVGVWEEFHAAAINAPRPNIDLLFTSSVPLGGGLSSSASLEVSIATLLSAMLHAELSPLDRTRVCQRAEHHYVGVPCGIMDMYTSVNACKGKALLIDCSDDTHECIPMPPTDMLGAVVLIVNSNVRHELASGEYAKRAAACKDAARIMGYSSLREVNCYREPAALGLLPEQHRDYVRHVTEENMRTNMVASILREAAAGEATWKRSLPAIGEQLYLSHESLRDQYAVSCPELDSLVEFARSTPGVYGARMTGGGFGGCIVALIRPHLVESIAARISAAYLARHGRAATVYATGAESGAAPLPLA